MIDVNLTLTEETDRQKFADSFNEIKLRYFSPDNSTDLLVLMEKSFLESVSLDSRVVSAKVLKEKDSYSNYSTYPPYPPKRYQQGTAILDFPTTGISTSPIRPEFGSSASIENQKITIHNAKNKKWLGSHFMPYSLNFLKRLNREQDPLRQSTLPVFGKHRDEDTRTGEYGHTLSPSVSSPSDSQYTSRFFGKDVDIIVLEAGGPPYIQGGSSGQEKFNAVKHPDFGFTPENDLNIIGNDGANLGDAPNGNYTHTGSRLILKDWDSDSTEWTRFVASSGTALGSTNALLSRYNNSNLQLSDRAALTTHMMQCCSAAAGLISGHGKAANIYPMYLQRNDITARDEINTIIEFHNSKPRNANVKYFVKGDPDALTLGVRNPTIVNMSFGATDELINFTPVENIKSINNKGVVTNRPSGGWGNNLQPFVDMHQIPCRMQNPSDNTEHFWVIPYGKAAIGSANVAKQIRYEKLWDAGIITVMGAGNTPNVKCKRDDIEFDNCSFTIDAGTDSYVCGVVNSLMNKFSIRTSSVERIIHPFRQTGPQGALRNKSIEVSAGQASEMYPGLTDFSSRGPGIDIIGEGDGVLTSTPTASAFHFQAPADTLIGAGSDLDPSSSMYSGGHPYPFDPSSDNNASNLKLFINSLGTGTDEENQTRWRTYLNTSTIVASSSLVIPSNTVRPLGSGSNQYFNTFKIVSLGSGTDVENQARWNTHFGTSGASYSVGLEFTFPNTSISLLTFNIPGASIIQVHKVGDLFTLPTPNTNIPAGSKASKEGFNYGYFSGTSCASPSVAGRIACMMEEYLHANGQWPTNTQAKELLISQAIEVNAEDNVVDWTNVPSASSMSDSNSLYKFIGSHKVIAPTQSTCLVSKYIDNNQAETTANNFHTKTGKLEPSSMGWTPINMAEVPINTSSIGSVSSTLRASPIGIVSTITAATSAGFKDTSNASFIPKVGQILNIASTSNASIATGSHTIESINTTANPPTITTVNKQFTGIDFNWQDSNPVTDFSNTTFKIQGDVPILYTGGQFSAELKNVSGVAGISCLIQLPAEPINFKVYSSKAVNLKLFKQDALQFDYNTALASGTITPETALASVDFAGIDKNGNISSAAFFDQLKLASFDFDGNGTADALTDGLLLLRYLFGLTGPSLTNDAIAPDSPMTPSEVEELLKSSENIQDIDGNGKVDALTDGLLLLRYLFGLVGDSLINGAVATDATRTTADEILAYINSFMPDTGVGTHGYRFSSSSAVPHSSRASLQTKNSSTGATEYFVSPTDPSLAGYSNPVGLQMFDSDKYFHSSVYDTTRPFTPYTGTSWRWTKPAGSLWTTTMGTLSSDTFTDAGGTSRTIRDMWWTEGQQEFSHRQTPDFVNPRTPNGILCFSLAGTNIPNTSSTFTGLNINSLSFDRKDAYYSANSNGNTVWWWHISTAPINNSEFSALGTKVTQWSITTESRNEKVFKPSEKNTYTLQINNVTNIAGDTSFINKVRVRPTSEMGFKEYLGSSGSNKSFHTVAPLGLTEAGGTPSSVHYMAHIRHTELAGTPPLRAFYDNNENSTISRPQTKAISIINSKAAPSDPTTGAIFPNTFSDISATNDLTDIEALITSTKYGWQREQTDTNLNPTNEGVETIEVEPDPELPDPESESVEEDTTVVTILQVLPTPVVPANNSAFTVGSPVTATVTPTGTATFIWQKSSNGTTWTDIANNDSIYTNAHTAQMTVTGYPSQDPVGEYYRCKVSDNNNISTSFTNIVQAVAA